MSARIQLAVMVLVVAVIAVAACSASERLLENVVVRRDRLLLTDLLPPKADDRLRKAAETIALGRAPAPGSMRIIGASELSRAGASSLGIEIPPEVTVRRAGQPIDPEEVRNSLSASKLLDGLDLSRAQILPPPEFVLASEHHPQLQVIGIRTASDQKTLAAEMRCRKRSDCGRFLVKLVFPEQVFPLVAGSLTPREKASVALNGGYLVAAGRPALLEIDGDGLKITESVVPLERARRGEIVRVRDRATRHILRCKVTGLDRLEDPASRAGEEGE